MDDPLVDELSAEERAAVHARLQQLRDERRQRGSSGPLRDPDGVIQIPGGYMIAGPAEDRRRVPTGPCGCPREEWRREGAWDRQQTQCQKCGRHWWMSNDEPTNDLTPFEPYSDRIKLLQVVAGLCLDRQLPPDDRPLLPVRLPKRAGRWNWWTFPEINPWAPRLNGEWYHDPYHRRAEWHRALSLICHRRYKDGDTQAVFDFVDSDPWAFRAEWLQRIIEEWREAADVDRLKKLMALYATRGKGRKVTTIIDEIRRDVRVYRFLVEDGGMWDDDGCELAAANAGRPRIGVYGVQEIRENYQHLWAKVEPLVPQLFASRAEMAVNLEALANRLMV